MLTTLFCNKSNKTMFDDLKKEEDQSEVSSKSNTEKKENIFSKNNSINPAEINKDVTKPDIFQPKNIDPTKQMFNELDEENSNKIFKKIFITFFVLLFLTIVIFLGLGFFNKIISKEKVQFKIPFFNKTEENKVSDNPADKEEDSDVIEKDIVEDIVIKDDIVVDSTINTTTASTTILNTISTTTDAVATTTQNSLEKPLDTDQDGLTDEEEKVLGTSPENVDSDADGIFDLEEIKIYKTDPLNPDTDNDGYTDGEEVKNGYNPIGSGLLYKE